MKALTDLLHLLLCQHPHIYDMMEIVNRKESNCYYYLETDIADSAELPDHIKWLDVVENFKFSLSLSSDQEALEFVKESIRIAQAIRELAGDDEGKMNFIHSIIN